ncbi:hypothetical protein BKA62DRAFT_38148 [Auriculariales sp. MPI-PUGE-AT-0066]|nr:hypothetical protein BKA62DRAFT_38148 [Auriculariales sp. MPI-PUGE-AT-0066]
MSHSSISSNSSRRQAKIDGRSVGYCYSIERKFAEPVLSGLNAFSAAARSVACFSEDSGLSVEDYHSVVESLRTTWSTRNFKPTERPCFVLRVDEEEKTADVFLLATFGGKTANQLDQLTRRFVASVEPTPPQPHDDSITGKTIPTWKRIPQHIVLIRATVSHSDLVRNLSNRGTVLDNYVELSVEAALREQEFQNQDKELRAREWRSHQKRLWRLRQPRLPQSTSFSALGAIPEASAAAPVQQEFLPEYPGVDASARYRVFQHNLLQVGLGLAAHLLSSRRHALIFAMAERSPTRCCVDIRFAVF